MLHTKRLAVLVVGTVMAFGAAESLAAGAEASGTT